MSHLTFKRWDQFTTSITVKDSEWTAIDITWATIYFIIRDSNNPDSLNDDDTGVKLKKDITSHTDASNWITSIAFTSTDTDIEPDEYYWEIQVSFSNNDIYSSATGTVTVENDLNKRI